MLSLSESNLKSLAKQSELNDDRETVPPLLLMKSTAIVN